MRASRHSFSRSVAWTLLGMAVLLLHGALLQQLWPAPPAPGAAARPALQIRALVAAAPPMPDAPKPVTEPATAPADAAALSPAATSAAPRTGQRAAAPSLRAPPRAASREPPAPSAAEAAPPAAAETAAPARAAVARPEPAALAAGDAPWPVYATRLPAAVELHYRVQRGDRVGRASLYWQPGDGGYELRLDTAWPGQAARGSASRGLIDGDGVAPVRHAELQRSRETRAVNFQREAGRITFSGPQLAYALRPGVQDRLSWLIQLPAILQADAALAQPGASVRIFVVGTRGDAEAWQFEVQRREALTLPAGPVAQALYLRREPTRPYDNRVEVWLDPARQHLPVRAVFTTVPGGPALDMALAEAGPETGLESEAAIPC